MKKNDIVTVHITDISHDGQGIGRTEEGRVVFVREALIGETVKVHILKVLKNTAYGKIESFVSQSSARCIPKCGIFSKCGGCSYMHTNYKNELTIKRERVKSALLGIAGIKCEVNETLGGAEYFYRNKMLIPLCMSKDGRIKAGFYRKNSHDIIPMEECCISHGDFKKITEKIIEFCEKFNVMPYDEKTKSGIIRHIFIRRGWHSGEIMAGVVTKTEKLPFSDEFVKALKSLGLNIVSVIQNINKKETNVILGDKTVILYGKPYITDFMLENKFFISCQAFYQVNTPMAEKLYETALSHIDEKDEIIFDLYSGAGTITLALARKAKKVIGIESCEPAVLNARQNSEENDITNAEFICGNAETEIFNLIGKGIIPDAVVLDPPRSGCDKKLISALLEAKPEKIIYISCNPSTMARDIKELSENYFLRDVQPVDLFPKTSHVETVVLMSRICSGE